MSKQAVSQDKELKKLRTTEIDLLLDIIKQLAGSLDSLNVDDCGMRHKYYLEFYDSNNNGSVDTKAYFSFSKAEVIQNADTLFPYININGTRISHNKLSYNPDERDEVTYAWTYDKVIGNYRFGGIIK